MGFKKLTAFLRFGQLSGFSFLLNVGTTVVLHEWFKLPATWAYAAAILMVSIFNFLILRFYVFPTTATHRPPFVQQATGFLASSAMFRLLEYLVFCGLHVVAGMYYIATICLVSAVSVVAKFLFYQKWLFGFHGSSVTTAARNPASGV